MRVDWKYITMALAMIILAGAIVLVPPLARGSGGTEGPVYSVVKEDGNVEIRDYPGYITAQVKVRSDYNSALYSGFMKLFNYISGQNTNRSKIKMTDLINFFSAAGSMTTNLAPFVWSPGSRLYN
jgi:hypothetical protein